MQSSEYCDSLRYWLWILSSIFFVPFLVGSNLTLRDLLEGDEESILYPYL